MGQFFDASSGEGGYHKYRPPTADVNAQTMIRAMLIMMNGPPASEDTAMTNRPTQYHHDERPACECYPGGPVLRSFPRSYPE
jgi:hypothetical protein